MPTRSLGFSSVGPEVGRIVPPVARAIKFASVVLPRPGGPENSTCSSGSPRRVAASIAMRRFSTTWVWPT